MQKKTNSVITILLIYIYIDSYCIAHLKLKYKQFKIPNTTQNISMVW